jgi:nitroimidazol reductase NimA-like FMN-containing flavoprotein (pyridoxamine 5'-phosphate oxidase superfamily)
MCAMTAEQLDVDRNGLHVLRRADCMARLATHSVGRVGLSMGALPVILPVNYCLVDDSVVFRTSPGTKLAAASEGAVVAFEVDEVDPISHAGWSVLVVGLARVVHDGDEVRRLQAAPVPRWSPGPDEAYVVIDAARVSGRRVGAA